jgi:hypothetical protein
MVESQVILVWKPAERIGIAGNRWQGGHRLRCDPALMWTPYAAVCAIWAIKRAGVAPLTETRMGLNDLLQTRGNRLCRGQMGKRPPEAIPGMTYNTKLVCLVHDVPDNHACQFGYGACASSILLLLALSVVHPSKHA